ncbi:hypothetical protein [Pseudomonas sp. VS38]|uniref:hypothetical protein n=1 Tax=Pseudomonas sp. VS38 TaxID=2834066 RepID=UPI001BDF000B|nr:hypothetical protein [Pseudomonas sp. VS38]MBT1266407.1 hypothetical protein [Pseudomonas sp. VS38]
MKASNSYVTSPQHQKTNGWMVAGVVIASPSSGQIKAMMPALNSYCDIRIEQIISLNSGAFDTIKSKNEEELQKIEVAFESKLKENMDAMVRLEQRIDAHKLSIWRLIMRQITSIDMRDLSIMVGLASLLGAATNMAFSFATGSAAPQVAVITITVLGFVCGRFLSDRLRHEHHE